MKYYPTQSNPNQFLMDVAVDGLAGAFANEIYSANPKHNDYKYVNLFPGEHYRFIKAVTEFLQPKTVIEIGTFTGLGVLAFLEGDFKGEVHTFDIHPWTEFPTHLEKIDFEYGVIQHLADLSKPDIFEQYRELFNKADIIFMDAPKDGTFEPKMVEQMRTLQPKDGRLLIMDDIILDEPMTKLWRSINAPKIDLTSLCHWSGTGLVDLSNPKML
jgi:predicted O-methyltransferase YrrM